MTASIHTSSQVTVGEQRVAIRSTSFDYFARDGKAASRVLVTPRVRIRWPARPISCCDFVSEYQPATQLCRAVLGGGPDER